MAMILKDILNVPNALGDEARKRRLLNIILLGILGFSVIIFVTGVAFLLLAHQANRQEIGDVLLLLGGSIALIVGTLIIFAINRYWSGTVAAWVFLLLLLVVISFSDTPEELTQGRSLFIYAIPILISSVVLTPQSSFYVAGLSSISILLLSDDLLLDFNVTAMSAFFIIALVAWLAARSLENALQELRTINAELDERVVQRTQELSQALEKVKAESLKNEAILASIADGVVVFDSKGQAFITNQAMTNLVDKTHADIVGQDIAAITQHKIDQLNYDNIEMSKIELEEKTFTVSMAPVRVGDGGTSEVVAVFHDFTREAQLDKMKDSFVSMASHELRTPLNAIIGYTDMMQAGVYGELPADQMRLTSRIMANTKRMLSLVNNLLDQAQMAAGQLKLHLHPFAVTELVDEVDAIVSVLAETKNLQFSIGVDDCFPPTIIGDRERLLQIIVNLTGNAVKFTDEGAVSIDISRRLDDQWAIVVHDTGQGIPQKALSQIFEPFHQASDAQTRRHGGSGLGLSIVRMLVQLMGGQITVESEVNVGSTFTITLPLVASKEEIAYEPQS